MKGTDDDTAIWNDVLDDVALGTTTGTTLDEDVTAMAEVESVEEIRGTAGASVTADSDG